VAAPAAGPLGFSRAGGDGALDLSGHGEAAGLLLREHQVAIHLDVEDAARSLDQVRTDAEPLLQLVRQTGGTGQVASRHAVLDADVFRHNDVSPWRIVCLDYNAYVYNWPCVYMFEGR
jgi:hypothetical protein